MTSLKEIWQTQRQQRQQERLHRQQQVRINLEQFSQQRQMQADHLRRELQAFQQQLQQETQELIAAASTDRLMMSQALFQNLSDFHQTLSSTVATLRQSMSDRMQVIQAETAAVRLDTQLLLQTYHQQRLQNQLQMTQSLAEFVETLHTEVEVYLAELEILRHDRANQLQQTLQQNHEQRKTEVKRLFNQLAVFRHELRQQVWGTSGSVSVPALPPVEMPRFDRKNSAASAAKPTVRLTQPHKITAIPGRASRKPAPTIQAQPAANLDLSHLEQTIFNHLKQVQQTTLAEVESTFAINRFAAVDALRSLIKKGCITQRDHVYLIQQ